MSNAAYFSQVVEEKKRLNQSCLSQTSPMNRQPLGPNGNLNNLPMRPVLNKECLQFLSSHFPDQNSWTSLSAQLFTQLLLKQHSDLIDA